MHPLDGPRLKLERAHEHLAALNAIHRKFMDSEPYGFVRQQDPRQDKIVMRAVVHDPPVEMGVVIGDFVQDTRAVLDHLVWQLALLGVPVPDDRSEFPVFHKPERYPDGASRRLRGVPGHARCLIEELQPYHRANRPHNELLMVIHELARFARHKLITTVNGKFDIAIGKTHFAGPLYDGDQFVFTRQRDQQFNIEITAEVVLGPGPGEGLSLAVLDHAHNFIRDHVLPRFDGFFPNPADYLRAQAPREPNIVEFGWS